MKDEHEKKDRLRELNALLDKINQKIERGTFYTSAVGAWALKHTPKKRDLAVLFLRWKTGYLHITLSNPVARVRALLDELEIEALSTIWEPGWGPVSPSGRLWQFKKADGTFQILTRGPTDPTPIISKTTLNGKTEVVTVLSDFKLKFETPDNARKVDVPVEVTDPNLAERIQQLIKDNPELREIPLPVKGEEYKP